jgi:hypothetical protein
MADHVCLTKANSLILCRRGAGQVLADVFSSSLGLSEGMGVKPGLGQGESESDSAVPISRGSGPVASVEIYAPPGHDVKKVPTSSLQSWE